MSNQSINSISPNIRDFLLNKNLIPFTESISSIGLGLPVSIELNQPLASSSVSTIDDNDDIFRENHVIKNIYKNSNINEEVNIISAGLIGNTSFDLSNPEYMGPSSLEDSRLDDNLLQFPYNNQKPLTYITARNLYNDPTQQIDVGERLYTVTPIGQQITSYLDEKGNIRGLSISDNAIDVIGALLTESKLNFSVNGLESNFDFRTSLIGRTLGPVVGDTPLGLIGSQQLLNAMLANSAQNLQEETIDRVNITGLFKKNEDFIIPNYDISVRDGEIGNVINIFERLSGAEIPSSPIEPDGSIYSKDTPGLDSSKRSQNLLSKYTGKGQANLLFLNLNENLYSPIYEYKDKKTNGNFYSSVIFNNLTNIFPDYSTLPEELLKEDISYSNGQGELRITNDNEENQFTWVDLVEDSSLIDSTFSNEKVNIFTPNSLLNRTQNLFNSGIIQSLINIDNAKVDKDEIQNISEINKKMSKGCAIVGVDNETFCRTWTTFKRYNQVANLQKHWGLIGDSKTRYRNNETASVLDDNGFPKIAPYKTDILDGSEIKKYMFSIENLAWGDDNDLLYPCEIGNGDPFEDPKIRKRGRIMWFPPYDINFTDNTSSNITTTQFIGRSEPVYTYNTVERIGTLSFKIIVDHPSWMNEETNRETLMENENRFARINAGCERLPDVPLTEQLDIKTRNEIDIKKIQDELPPIPVVDDRELNLSYFVYFPNDVSTWEFETRAYTLNGITYGSGGTKSIFDYENGDSQGLGLIQNSGTYFAPPANTWSIKYARDITDFGKNIEFINSLSGNIISNILISYPNSRIKIYGYASEQGTPQPNSIETNDQINQRLSNDRATTIKNKLLEILSETVNSNMPENSLSLNERIDLVKGEGETPSTFIGNRDDSTIKDGRYVRIEIVNVPEKSPDISPTYKYLRTDTQITDTYKNTLKKRFYCEAEYFEKLKREDKFAYDKIKRYIKYFHPAFHSITPEGLNSRLTFLHQCTRQGPSKMSDDATNLAFGRPPFCILRIGDFYHTRVIFDSINVSYDPLVWDLNPEGIGVQPMIAHVDMSFKFVGGQSIQGPINKLQNAISFNFLANTELYDMRADSFKISNDEKGYTSEVIEGSTAFSAITSTELVNSVQTQTTTIYGSELSATFDINNLGIR